MTVKSNRELIVWQKTMEVGQGCLHVERELPQGRALWPSLIRRAAASVPSNIAEGQARRSTREFVQFISQAEGSLAEVDTQLLLAVDLGYVTAERITHASELVNECQRMLNAMRVKPTTDH